MRYTPINQFFVLFFFPACIYCFIFFPFAWNNSLDAYFNFDYHNNFYTNFISLGAAFDAKNIHTFLRAYITIPLGILFSLIFTLSLFKFNKQKNIQWAVELPYYFSRKLKYGMLWIYSIIGYILIGAEHAYTNKSHLTESSSFLVGGAEFLIMMTIGYCMGYFAVLGLKREKNELMG